MRNQKFNIWFCSIFIGLLSLFTQLTQADESSRFNVPDFNQPAISIIIDDMGYRLKSGHRAVNLPGAVTYSFLPHTPHVKMLSQSAHDKNKEVMLHLPMESESGNKLGPGGLTGGMSEKNFTDVLQSSIDSIPHAIGFNNHMGSLLTQSQGWMKKLMQKVAKDNKLFFVDSRTTSNSVALKVAHEAGLKSIERDIFIDHDLSEELIQKQLKKLVRRAQLKGTALAIAHPKKMTLAILEQWLPELKSKGIRLVPVSELIKLQQQRTIALWQKTLHQ